MGIVDVWENFLGLQFIISIRFLIFFPISSCHNPRFKSFMIWVTMKFCSLSIQSRLRWNLTPEQVENFKSMNKSPSQNKWSVSFSDGKWRSWERERAGKVKFWFVFRFDINLNILSRSSGSFVVFSNLNFYWNPPESCQSMLESSWSIGPQKYLVLLILNLIQIWFFSVFVPVAF